MREGCGMSGYAYHGTETIEAAEQRREQLKAELAAAREAYKAAQKLARENQRIEQQILRTEQQTRQLTPKPVAPVATVKQLPPPRYGGPGGLLAATREAATWGRKKRAA